jgi:preprotein translocase subunit SecA
VQIVDEYTGRLMPDRSWEQGLHQLIEVKEGCTMTNPRETLARITYQRFFRRYLHLSGMTGTATEVADELWSVYRLKVSRIPTHKPAQRHEFKPRLMKNQDQKWQSVVAAVQRESLENKRPVLIGTRSVEASERLSSYLTLAGVAHQVLNARQDAEEAQLIELAGQPNVVTVATNMAGRGTDIKLGEGVAGAGGLHVILTEFHDSSRIDRQLYGRCGRQGDPGSFQAIVAADDELFRFYATDWLHRLMAAEVVPASTSIHLFRKMSQLRAEKQHAKIRNQTLDLDHQIDRMLSFSGRH